MKNLWLNLPVKNVQRSKEFFRAIGFKENPMHADNDQVGSFFIGEHNTVLMLFTEETFAGFTQHAVTDTAKSNEILLNISAENPAEVDTMAETVRKAGGKIYAEPGESQGWMYAFGFEDLDGHRWSMLYMDMKKMPH